MSAAWREDADLPAGHELSELDAEYRCAPHARLDRLRRQAPRYLDPSSDGGRLFLTRYADVRAALVDRTLSRDAAKIHSRGASAVPNTMLDKEGEDLLVARTLVGRAFDARGVEARRPAIAAIIAEAVGALDGRTGFDAMAEFAAPIPIRVMTQIFGLAQDNLAQIRAWSEDAAVLAMHPARTEEQTLRLMTAVAGIQHYVFSAVAERRATPRCDLLSELIGADANGRPLRDDEIAPIVIFGMIAGSLTTTDLIGNTIVLLLQHPKQRALLRARPELIAGAVEEALRLEPPVSAVARHATEEREVFGCPLRAGGTVKASLLAANHDAEIFPNPHAFSIARADGRHVSFGGGAHACLGAGLARLEAQLAVEKLFARFPKLALAEAPERKTAYGFRGFSRIPLSTA